MDCQANSQESSLLPILRCSPARGCVARNSSMEVLVQFGSLTRHFHFWWSRTLCRLLHQLHHDGASQRRVNVIATEALLKYPVQAAYPYMAPVTHCCTTTSLPALQACASHARSALKNTTKKCMYQSSYINEYTILKFGRELRTCRRRR
jgi:hypothetical protein